MAPLATLFTYQPFKTLYVLVAAITNIFTLPILTTKYAFAGRPHPLWSVRQAMGVRIMRAIVDTVCVIRIATPLPLTPGKEGDRFQLIKAHASNADKFKGPMLASAETVQPVDIGATWYPSRLGAADAHDAVVILHIHGGAYVLGDGRTADQGAMTKMLARHTPATHILCPQYRLSTLPAGPTSNPFPAALQDALTSYLYLLHELRVPASRIVLSGDSAGGHCAAALLRYIEAFGDELDIPRLGAVLLWSPWIDPTDIDEGFVVNNANYGSDYIEPSLSRWGVLAFAGLKGPRGLVGNPYANMKVSGFKTRVPVYVNLGGAELLYFDGKEWVESMKKEGSEVVLDVTPGAPHDVLLGAELLGMVGMAKDMAKGAGEWMVGLGIKG